MNKGIGQHFANGLVDRGVIIPRHVVGSNLERDLDSSGNRLADPEEEIKNITAPRGIARTDSIRPPNARRKMLTIVKEEIGQFVRNGIEVGKANKSRNRRMNLMVAASLGRADLHQELVVRQAVPDVIGMKVRKQRPITPQGVRIQVGHRPLLKHACVGRDLTLIANHRLDRLARTPVIPFAVPSERTPEDIFANIYRTILSLGSRHFDDDNVLSAAIHNLHVALEDNLGTDLIGRMDHVPEVSYDLSGVLNTLNRKLMILLANAEEDHAAVRIRKGAEGFPESAGNLPFRQLAFDGERLAPLQRLPNDLFSVNHVRYLQKLYHHSDWREVPDTMRQPRPLANATTILRYLSESFGLASLNSSATFSPCAISSLSVISSPPLQIISSRPSHWQTRTPISGIRHANSACI